MSCPIQVRECMSAAPYSLELESSLASAAVCLRQLGVPSLPVVDERGAVVGVISEREVALARRLGADLHEIPLRKVVLDDFCVASPDTPLSRLARTMTTQRVACAVVEEAGQPLGVVTLERALAGLAQAFAPEGEERELSPSQVRRAILIEHTNIRRRMQRLERSVRSILSTPIPQLSDLDETREAARALCTTMVAHFALEERVLAPALEALDGWGKLRADRMRTDHREQDFLMQSYLAALESESTGTAPLLVAIVQQLIDHLRQDMDSEEQTLLHPDLLADMPSTVSVETG